MSARAARIAAALLLMLAARPGAGAAVAPAPVTAAQRGAAIAEAGKLADEMDALVKADDLFALTKSHQVVTALLPALREPAIHDPAAAAILARVALQLQNMEVYAAMALVEDCLKDAPNDAALRAYAAKLKPLVKEDYYASFLQDRADLKQAVVKARAGDLEGMFNAGEAFMGGHGTLTDHDQARAYLAPAADAGHAGAMGDIGIFEEVDSKAVVWFEKAFNGGNYALADNLAEIHTQRRLGMFKQHDVPRDMDKGFLWYRLSLHAGYSGSAADLAAICDDKTSGKYFDPAAALGYWRLAAEHYDAAARKLLKERNLTQLDLGFKRDAAPKPKLQSGREPEPITLTVMRLGLSGDAAKKLQADDVITEVAGQSFRSEFDFRRLAYATADGKITLGLARKGQKMTVTIAAEAKP